MRLNLGAGDTKFEGYTSVDKWLRHIWGEYYRYWDTGRYEDALNHEGSKHVTGFTFNRLKRIVEPIGFSISKNETKHLDVPENLSVRLTK